MSLRDLFSGRKKIKPCPAEYTGYVLEEIKWEDLDEFELHLTNTFHDTEIPRHMKFHHMEWQKQEKKKYGFTYMMEYIIIYKKQRPTTRSGEPCPTYSHVIAREKREDCMVVATDMDIPVLENVKTTEHYFDSNRNCHVYVFHFKKPEDLVNNPEYVRFAIFAAIADKNWFIDQKIYDAISARSANDKSNFWKTVDKVILSREGIYDYCMQKKY